MSEKNNSVSRKNVLSLLSFKPKNQKEITTTYVENKVKAIDKLKNNKI